MLPRKLANIVVAFTHNQVVFYLILLIWHTSDHPNTFQAPDQIGSRLVHSDLIFIYASNCLDALSIVWTTRITQMATYSNK